MVGVAFSGVPFGASLNEKNVDPVYPTEYGLVKNRTTVNTNLFRLKFFPSLGKTDPLNFGSGNYRCFVFLVIGS